MLHSEILPEHDCGGELIELPRMSRRMFPSPSVLVVGRNLPSVPDSDWVTVVYPGMLNLRPPQEPQEWFVQQEKVAREKFLMARPLVSDTDWYPSRGILSVMAILRQLRHLALTAHQM